MWYPAWSTFTNSGFMGFIVASWDLNGIYPLVNLYKKLWNISIFHGKTHYFDWAMASIAM